MSTCSLHGPYTGSRCHRCEVEEQLRDQSRIAEEAEREAANRHWEAEVAADYRARELANHQADLVRNANKIKARSLTNRARELFEAGLYLEATETCRDALKEDRGWVSAYAIMAASLYESGKRDEAAESMLKAIRLLGYGEWKTSNIFDVVLSWIGDKTYPDEVAQELRRKIAEHIGLADAKLVRRLAQWGWGKEVLDSLAYVTLTYDDACHVVQSLLAKDQVSVAEAALQRTLALKESIPVANSYESWLNLALWAAAIECQGGHSKVFENMVRQAEKCPPQDGLGLLQFLGANSKFSDLDVIRRNVLLGRLAPFSIRWLNSREAAVVEQAKNSVVPPSPLLAWIPSVQTRNSLAREREAATATSAHRKALSSILKQSGMLRFLEMPSAESAWRTRTPEIARADKAWAGEVLFSCALRAKTNKNFVSALSTFQEAAERFKEAEELTSVSSCLLQMGWCTCPDQNTQGEWRQANEFFRQATATAESSGPDNVNIAIGLWGQGWCAEPTNNPKGDWGVSITFYKRAADAGRQAKNAWWESDSLHAVGFCYEPTHAPFGDWETASEWYRRAAEIRSAANLELPLANTFFRLAVCLSKGEPSKTTPDAANLFEQARLLFQKKSDAAGVEKIDSWLKPPEAGE